MEILYRFLICGSLKEENYTPFSQILVWLDPKALSVLALDDYKLIQFDYNPHKQTQHLEILSNSWNQWIEGYPIYI